MANEYTNSAGPALRGFRLQILYTLARLTEPQTALQASLCPEGVEDLAIFDDQGALREAIQVKGHAAPLTLSELISTSGRGLLQRAVTIAREHPECRVRLLSFGPYGQELSDAWRGPSGARERVQGKLRHAGFKAADIALLFTRLSLESTDEAAETAKVERFLAAYPTLLGESSHAAAILSSWLYGAAERAERIVQSDLIARLAHVGRFIQTRATCSRDWFSVVEPLDRDADPESEWERLRAQFQQGMSAHYGHILAGCDVPRRYWLDQISDGFTRAHVVIVHGASGQGKSALAYRWLHEETPDLWRFEIKLVDTRRDALQIAATLSAHARAVGAPMTIYIDVRPGDSAWTELVQELSRLTQVRVLVTIREEDWRRATLSGAAVAFVEIALTLEQAEAGEIYRLLDRSSKPAPFLSFEDVWCRFVGSAGNDGPLMEFVYLVTRTETLRDRLKQQVNAIRDAAIDGQTSAAGLRVLALVSFASALGARLDVATLRRDLPDVDLGRIVERLEREYLIRRLNQNLLLDGLHPVRSRLLADILCDGMTFDAQELARHCLGLIAAEDTEVFLLHLATRYADLMPGMVRHLDEWQPPTWAAIGGVLRALLWWGARQYVDQIAGLVSEIRSKNGKAWMAILDLDLANLLPPHGTAVWKQIDVIGLDKKALFQSLLDRQPPKALAVAFAHHWLAVLASQPAAPTSEGDWAAVAELSYWIGHWSLAVRSRDWLRAIDLDAALDGLPLRLMADLLRGRWELQGEEIRPWLDRHRDQIARRFRSETNTPWIEGDGTVRAHFLISWAEITAESAPDADEAKRKNLLHAMAIERVELLRGLFPNCEGYGCQGYGHRVLPMSHDDSVKTSIKPEGLPPDWAMRINGIATALIDWRYRPDDWSEYLSRLWTIREMMALVMRDLRRALVAHFRDRRKQQTIGKRIDLKAWDELKDTLSRDLLLPRQAVDEWGFTNEGRDPSNQGNVSRMSQGFALAPFNVYLKAKSDLFCGLENFLEQAVPYLFLHCAEGKNGLDISRLLIEAKLAESGGTLVRPELISYNLAQAASALPRFQHEIRRLFAHRLPAEQFDELDRCERKEFDALLPLWGAYLANPDAHWPDAAQRTKAMVERPLTQFQAQVTRALRSLEPEGVRARILGQLTGWEDAPALWIAVDSENLVHALNPSALVKPVLRRAVLEASFNEQQIGALERRWANVVILAAFKGRSIDRRAWLLPIYRLTANDPSSEFAWLDEIPRPVGDAEWARTGLHCWSTPEIDEAKELLLVIGRFKVLTDHLSGCLELARVDGADHAILQTYLERCQADWSGIIQGLIDHLGALAGRYNRLSVQDQQQRPLLAAAAVVTRDHFHDWLPAGLDEGPVTLSVDGCQDWLNAVAANIDTLASVGAAVLADSLGQAGVS